MNSLLQFFEKVQRDRWSGEVTVASSQGNAIVLVSQGDLVWCHRPLERAIERFSKITWIQMPPPAVAQSIKSWEEFIQMLQNLNQDKPDRLIRFLKTDRLELFFRLFFWSNVEMTPRAFEVEPPDPVTLGFYKLKSMATLLKEARRRLEEWPEIQAQIGNGKRVFKCIVDLPEDDSLAHDAIDQVLAEQDLVSQSLSPHTLEELEILRLCDGTLSVQDVIRQTTDGEFLTLRRIIHLWQKGALAPKDSQATALRPKPAMSRVTWTQDFRSLALQLVVIATLLGVGSMMHSPPPHSTRELQQFLELYRASEQRYPLTLQELMNRYPEAKNSVGQTTYRLLHPTRYELTE
jgi:hypothetical protein